MPNATALGLAESVAVPGGTPVPDSDTVNDGFDALELTVNVPDCAVAVVGANVTVTVHEAFATKVPQLLVCENWPVPLTATPVTLPEAVPVLVMVTVRVEEVLIPWLPKATGFGVAESVAVPGGTPVPDSSTVKDGLLALEATVSVPVCDVAVLGANVTVTVHEALRSQRAAVVRLRELAGAADAHTRDIGRGTARVGDSHGTRRRSVGRLVAEGDGCSGSPTMSPALMPHRFRTPRSGLQPSRYSP